MKANLYDMNDLFVKQIEVNNPGNDIEIPEKYSLRVQAPPPKITDLQHVGWQPKIRYMLLYKWEGVLIYKERMRNFRKNSGNEFVKISNW
jgi:hypothetical protein